MPYDSYCNNWRDAYAEYCNETERDARGGYDWETENAIYFFNEPEKSYKQRWARALTER